MKKPILLLINDIHVSKDTIDEFEKNWDEAINICLSNRIERIVVGGDLWQSRSSQTLSTLRAVSEALIKTRKNGISVVLAEGNHDKVDQEDYFGYSHIFNEYPYVEVVDYHKSYYLGNDWNFHVMSYLPEAGSFCEHLNILIKRMDNEAHNILYIHEGINGALSTPSDNELSTNIFDCFDKVLVGHYHNRCIIKDTNIEYIGSSRQHNFGEDEEKGYTIVYNDGSYKFVKNQTNIRYTVIDATPEEITQTLYIILEGIKNDGKYKVKVRIRCNSNQVSTVDKEKLIEAGACKVEFVTEETEISEIASQSLERKFDKTGIKDEYSKFCEEKKIDVQLGLEYLNKLN